MPRVIRYPRSSVTWADLKGRLLRVPGIDGIAWIVTSPTVHHGRITLRSLYNGTHSEENFTTIRTWVDRGHLTVSESPVFSARTDDHVTRFAPGQRPA